MATFGSLKILNQKLKNYSMIHLLVKWLAGSRIKFWICHFNTDLIYIGIYYSRLPLHNLSTQTHENSLQDLRDTGNSIGIINTDCNGFRFLLNINIVLRNGSGRIKSGFIH
jgi:hypothetical protein